MSGLGVPQHGDFAFGSPLKPKAKALKKDAAIPRKCISAARDTGQLRLHPTLMDAMTDEECPCSSFRFSSAESHGVSLPSWALGWGSFLRELGFRKVPQGFTWAGGDTWAYFGGMGFP